MDLEEDLTAGPAAPLVLAVLAEGEGDGYAIVRRVRELSGGTLDWADGMLYPLLHRLRRMGYVTTTWRATPDGHRRCTYALSSSAPSTGARRGHRTPRSTGPGGWNGLLLRGRTPAGSRVRPVSPLGAWA